MRLGAFSSWTEVSKELERVAAVSIADRGVSIADLHLPHPPVRAMINLQEMIWRISSSGRCIMIVEAASKL
jgi:hypothetical protein